MNNTSKKESKADNALECKQVDRSEMLHLRIAGLQLLGKGSEGGLWFLRWLLRSKISPLSEMVHRKRIWKTKKEIKIKVRSQASASIPRRNYAETVWSEWLIPSASGQASSGIGVGLNPQTGIIIDLERRGMQKAVKQARCVSCSINMGYINI